MPRLLAAKRPAVRIERLQDVAVADPDRLHLHPSGLHRLMEAEVRHHRDHNGPAGEQAPARQVGREKGEQTVAVDNVAAGIDGDHPVGVAVEGQAQVSALRDNGPGQLAGVRGAAVLIDVRAVRL